MRTHLGIPLLAFIIAACFCVHSAAGQTELSVSMSSGFAGYFRHGHFTPVVVRVNTGPAPLSGRMVITSDAVTIEKQIAVPGSSAREYYLAVPLSLGPIAELGLRSGARMEYQPKAVAPSARLIALLGGAPPRIAALLRHLPEGSQTAQIEARDLPEDFRAYEALDLLLIADLSSAPRDEQRQAMTAWLTRGGRMLIVSPPAGADSISSFWRRFFPADHFRTQRRLEGREMARSLRDAGLDVIYDERFESLAGFRVGLGRVMISQYEHAYANDGDDAATLATLRLLELDRPPQRQPNPLLAPLAYEMSTPAEWPAGPRKTLWLAAVGYVLAMAITLIVLRSEKPLIFALSAVGFAAVFAAVIYLLLLPRSMVALESVSHACTQSGASSAASTRYVNFTTPGTGEVKVRASFDTPAKPLFYSDLMLSQGPVHVRVSNGASAYDTGLGSGRPTCFEQAGVLSFQGSVRITELSADRYAISNEMRTIGTGDAIDFSDLIFTDGTDAVFIERLALGESVTVDFSPGSRASLGRIVWDHFAATRPSQHRVLRHWISTNPPDGRLRLLGWNRMQPMPEISGRFLARKESETLWEIRHRDDMPLK
ncbi:MAG TPA: hypothetical protein VM141_03300 [Planctomycetota bacterium]|nr:hypothetical protein [Planctomycetota bacterium]